MVPERLVGRKIWEDRSFGEDLAHHEAQLPWEIECLVQAGLEPWQALASVTWRGGELLGEPDAGVAREGGPAKGESIGDDPRRAGP